MKWFYSKDGQQIGPVDFSEIQRLHSEGQLAADSLVWEQGSPQWVPLSSVIGGTTVPAAPVTAPAFGSSLPVSAPGKLKSDFGTILCWGILALLIPCVGTIVYIALFVMHLMEYFEVRKAVQAGQLPASDYSKVHPALFIIGLFCCGIIGYPLFMHYRNTSGYFKQQPYAVWVAIAAIVLMIGINVVIQVISAAAQAAAR